MKQVVKAVLLFSLISVKVHAQSASDTSFTRQKQAIDAQIQLIDSNKLLTANLFNGTLQWGEFNANCYHLLEDKTILKLEFFFVTGTGGKKIFYYNKDIPIKIIDNGVEYYIGNSMFDKKGNIIKDLATNDLIMFSKEARKMIFALL
jgi:hypothetical protein